VVLKEVKASVNTNNELFAKGQIQHESKVYNFSYKTYDQFKKTNLGAKQENQSLVNEDIIQNGFDANFPEIYPECQNLPEYKNWAAEGKVSPVLQQLCEDCYVFSALTTVEATVAIQYKKDPVLLSRQNVLECIKDITKPRYFNMYNGCNTGQEQWIWQHAKEMRGLVPDSAYGPYFGNSNGQCNSNLAREADAEVHHWESLQPNNEEAMKCYVANYGPLTVGITTVGNNNYPSGLREYNRGIYTDPGNTCEGKQIDHSLTIVGYGSEWVNGVNVPYWIMQNRFVNLVKFCHCLFSNLNFSWGNSWGENGFVRFARNRNLCGVASQPKFPVLKNSKLSMLRPVKPAAGLCSQTKDIFSANNVYIKSICVSSGAGTDYKVFREMANEKGMQLYKSDSSQVDAAVLDFLSRKFNYFSVYIEDESGGCTTFDFDKVSQSHKLKYGDCSAFNSFLYEFLNIQCELKELIQ
jgi:C1A family cysteine protease